MQKEKTPVVVVLGHVDHGKTTLLDAIRKTRVQIREVGGITQSIGASVVKFKNKKLTFIDTPGHLAFAKMRSQGSKVADLAVLVVAADDGVKPQTKEALTHIREAEIPFIVALTKVDLASANPEAALGQLEKEGVFFEGRGGDTACVKVSAKEGLGLDELLELLVLLGELKEIKADDQAPLEAVVIETGKDKQGALVSLVVKNGTLKVGQDISAGGISCRVKAIFNSLGVKVKEVFPGEPGLVLGFSSLPSVGLLVTEGKKEMAPAGLKAFQGKKIKLGETPLLIKASSAGALGAILEGIPQEAVAISSGVGEVTESDIFLAKQAGASIFAFGLKITPNISRLADTEGVKLKSFKIIYELFDEIKALVEASQEKVLGKARIETSFPFNKRRVAGCKVLEGEIAKNTNLFLTRGEKKLGKIKVVSMKKGKEDVVSVKTGEEFGLLFEPSLDFTQGDVILSVN